MDWRVAAVGLALVLAGCGALGGTSGTADPGTGPASGATLTPVAVPSTTETPVTLPPGVTTAGVADADALLAAHQATLRDRSYTLAVRLEVDGDVTRRVSRVASQTRYYQRDVLVRQGVTVSRFASDRTVYTRSVTANLTRYDRFDTVRPPGSQTVRESRVFLSVPSATVFRTTVDGRPTFALRGTYPVHPTEPGLRNVSLRAVVAPSGLIRTLNVSYYREADAANVTRSFAYSDVGSTTVERPDWVDDQWNETTPE